MLCLLTCSLAREAAVGSRVGGGEAGISAFLAQTVFLKVMRRRA